MNVSLDFSAMLDFCLSPEASAEGGSDVCNVCGSRSWQDVMSSMILAYPKFLGCSDASFKGHPLWKNEIVHWNGTDCSTVSQLAGNIGELGRLCGRSRCCQICNTWHPHRVGEMWDDATWFQDNGTEAIDFGHAEYGGVFLISPEHLQMNSFWRHGSPAATGKRCPQHRYLKCCVSSCRNFHGVSQNQSNEPVTG